LKIPLGRAKRKGVGGKEFLPALAFAASFFAAAIFRASEADAPPYNFFTASDPFVEIITEIILFVLIMNVAILTISPFLTN